MSTSLIENLNFLEELNRKIIKYYDKDEVVSNITSETVTIQKVHFTKYQIPKADFRRVLDIIKEELLLILPQESSTGAVEAYIIFDLQGQILLRFDASNLPDCYTLKSIFSYCRTEENKDILAQLAADKILSAKMREAFEWLFISTPRYFPEFFLLLNKKKRCAKMHDPRMFYSNSIGSLLNVGTSNFFFPSDEGK